MRDFTINEKDKKDYITNVEANDNKYIIHYADGHSAQGSTVSKHNYLFYLNKMEEQFMQYKDAYEEVITYDYGMTLIKSIGILITQIAMFPILYNIDIHIAIKIIIGLLYLSGTIFYNTYNKAKIVNYDKAIGNIRAVEYYLEHKDDFIVNYKNEESGRLEKSYLVNANNVDIFSSPQMLIDFMNDTIEDYKDKQITLNKEVKKQC